MIQGLLTEMQNPECCLPMYCSHCRDKDGSKLFMDKDGLVIKVRLNKKTQGVVGSGQETKAQC